jgi:hypothetical protein
MLTVISKDLLDHLRLIAFEENCIAYIISSLLIIFLRKLYCYTHYLFGKMPLHDNYKTIELIKQVSFSCH